MKEREKIDIANQNAERQVSIGVVEHISKSKPPLSVKYLSLNCQILVAKLSNTHLIVNYLSLDSQILTSLSKWTDPKLRLAAWRRLWWNCGSLSVSSTSTLSHL